MLGACILTFTFVGSIVGQLNFHDELTPGELQTYFGVQTKEDVPSYEVVSPVHLEGSGQRPSLLSPKDPLKYHLKAFGENFTLHLNHNQQLIAPGCLVHQLGTNGSRRVRPCPTHGDDCFYHGSSANHNGSVVSLSTCNGLNGLIRLPDRDHDLWIQPVATQHLHRARRSTSSPLPHPHVVYKRAVQHRHCATDGVPEVQSLVSEALSRARQRRAVGEKHAEMLLVADPTMHRRYGDDLKHYLLTVANVAARVLLDPSLGTRVHFSVVKIQILEVDQPGLVIEADTDRTLESFCQWQEQFNPKEDSHPQHYDGAALLTRVDLIHRGVQSTTGLATVGGMCGARMRCSISEDNGLSVGLTLAHETGHSLGMSHDGSGNSCENGKYVMSSMGGGGSTAMAWSTCSRQALMDFLATSKAGCLNDQPQSSVSVPKDLPGVIYDGDEQCELYAGQGSTLCLGSTMVHGDECTHLVCFDPAKSGTCIGDSVPRLDGTMCGDRKYCMHGTCVDIGPNGPQPINGGWSNWETTWSACSRSCGGGVRVRRRKCDNPKPRLGGRKCEGSDIVAEMCNMKDCGSTDKQFRQAQCAGTDSTPFNGQNYHWIPVNMRGDRECELHCQIEGQRTVLLRYQGGKSWYQDGTPCSPPHGSFGRCVDGKCREFGCDGKTDSSYQFDKCGVCGGSGNTCRKQSGTFTQGRKQEYVTFVTVPQGSTALTITNTNHFTQMSIRVGGRRVFNVAGDRTDSTGVYTANGITVHYRSGLGGQETITITHPLPQPVEAQVWRKFSDTEFQGVAPQISYEYFVPTTARPQPGYVWKSRNADCSRSCGGGVYLQVITCTSGSAGSQVDDHFCDLRHKPSLTGAACNNQPCPPRWKAGQFSACSKTCGGGHQTRAVDCVQDQGGVEMVIAASNCAPGRRPQDSQACNVGVACPAVWHAGDWSTCSLTCGKGTRTRSVKCVSDAANNQEVDASLCPRDAKPGVTEACVNAICSPDITGEACKDTDSSCGGYALNMCEEYASFAHTSCMKHCAFCSPDGTIGEDCVDKNTDCAAYGESVCSGQYAQWASENCRKMCGLCSTGKPATCEDRSADCEGYGQSVCSGQYTEWARTECAKFCGHCGSGSTTNNNNNNNGGGSGGGACEDKSEDCTGYGQDICTGQYAAWASDNCARLCGHCSAAATVSASCADKVDNCADYGKSVCTGTYADWASDNCPKYCEQCSARTSANTNCQDKTGDCAQYGSDACSSYRDWASENCPKFCNMCSRRRRRSVLSPPPPPPPRPTCNTVLRGVSGSLSLIGQPLATPCTHVIAAPLGFRVRLTFTSLLIDCEQGDWLEVREEGRKKAKGGPPHPTDLCQHTPHPVQWTSRDHVVTVELRAALPGHGYNLTYTALPSSPPAPVHDCDRLLTDPTGAVGSPRLLSQNLTAKGEGYCVSTIVAPPLYTVRLHFNVFRLDDLHCDKDSVTIHDVVFNTQDVFCGTRHDLTWQSKGNQVKVVYTNSQRSQGTEFMASYQFVAP